MFICKSLEKSQRALEKSTVLSWWDTLLLFRQRFILFGYARRVAAVYEKPWHPR
jgi:hypothetical protein